MMIQAWIFLIAVMLNKLLAYLYQLAFRGNKLGNKLRSS